MKYLISDYKSAPLPFLTSDPIYLRYILFISFSDQISYILVISTKFLFFVTFDPILALYYVYIIHCVYIRYVYIVYISVFGNMRYILVISNQFPAI